MLYTIDFIWLETVFKKISIEFSIKINIYFVYQILLFENKNLFDYLITIFNFLIFNYYLRDYY